MLCSLNTKLAQAGAEAVSGLPANCTVADPTSPSDSEEEDKA